MVHARIVVTSANGQSIADRSQSAQRCGRRTFYRAACRGAAERTRAGADRKHRAFRERPRHPLSLARSRALLREIVAHAALVVLGHERPFVLIAPIQERELEREPGVVEQRRVLRPGHDRAR